MNCAKCQTRLNDDATECASCGAPVLVEPSFQLGAATSGTVRAEDETPRAYGPTGQPYGWNGVGPVPQDGSILWNGYSGWWLRLGASTIDSLIVLTMLAVVFVIAYLISQPVRSVSSGAQDIVTIVMMLVWLALDIAYFAWFDSSSKQGTFGRRATGVVVCDKQGRRLSVGRAAARHTCSLVLTVLRIPDLISAITIAASERKQALHDMLLGSVVVRRRPSQQAHEHLQRFADRQPPGHLGADTALDNEWRAVHMNCSNCHTALPPAAATCPGCGATMLAPLTPDSIPQDGSVLAHGLAGFWLRVAALLLDGLFASAVFMPV